MGHLIPTPLPIVYINPNKDVTVREGLDMSYSEEVYGVQIPVVADYKLRTVFVSKVNGPTTDISAVTGYNLSAVDEQAIKLTVPCENKTPDYFTGREHVLCVRDLMALRKIVPLFDKTMQIMRENNIRAEELRYGSYWALSDNVWNLHDSTQSDLCNVRPADHLYSVNMTEQVSIFECVKEWGASYFWACDKKNLVYHIRTGYMLSDEPKISKNSLIGQIVAKYFV